MIAIICGSLGLYYIHNKAPADVLVVIDNDIRDTVNRGYKSVILTSVSAAGLGVGGAVAAFIAEAAIVLLRFINFGIINYKIKVFLCMVSCSHMFETRKFLLHG